MHQQEFEQATRILNSRWTSFKFKILIVILAAILSIGTYYLLLEYLEKEKDIFTALIELTFYNPTYQFWCHLQCHVQPNDYYSSADEENSASIYFKLSKEVLNNSENVNIIPRGQNGSALENAYGVLNHSKAFGIVQSDTYLEAEFIKDKEKVIEISELYMERLHILYIEDPDLDANSSLLDRLSIIDSDDPTSIQVIQNAVDKGSLLAGSPTSAARMLLPHLFEVWGVKNGFKSQVGFEELDQIIETSLDTTADYKYPRIVVFIVGTNTEIIRKIHETYHAKLLGVSPVDINKANLSPKVDLEVTTFGHNYAGYINLPTAGAFATLIGSSDLDSKDIHSFLKILEKAFNQDELKNLVTNPPIVLNDVKDFYRSDQVKASLILLRSFGIFLITILSSTWVFANILLRYISMYKQGSYYKAIISVYREVVRKNNEKNTDDGRPKHQLQLEKASRLVKGMETLETIGKKVREDYNTGGITISHHKYLIDNANHVFSWFESKLTNRMAYVIRSVSVTIANELNLKDVILNWHSDGFLSKDSYIYLMQSFNQK